MLRGRSSNRVGVWMFFVLLAVPALAGAAGTIELISGTATVSDSFGTSEQPVLSADGRYVAFVSDAANLVPGQEDDNNTRDVFFHDRLLGTTLLVSHVPGSPKRAAAPGQYNSLEISADGRYVAFSSSSADLAPGAGDNGSNLDVFLWDRITGSNTLVSHLAGTPGTSGDGSSFGVRMNADASFLVVLSNARNLVAGQTEPGPNQQTADVFLWNRASDTMTLVSRSSGTTAGTSVIAANQSSSAMAISADGGVVVFASMATDLLPNLTVVGVGSQIYAYERATGNLSLITRSATHPNLAVGAQHDPVLISNDGRYVAFTSTSADLVSGQLDTESFFSPDAFLYDRTTGEMRLVSHRSSSQLLAAGISSSGGLSMSADGRYVAFASSAPDLVPGQVDPLVSHLSTDVFVWDRNSGLIALASHSRDSLVTAGSPGPTDTSGTSGAPRLSADGRFLVFHSTAVNLVHGVNDTVGAVDVFLYDQTTREVTLVSRTRGGAPANWRSYFPILSADGSVAAFISEATDLGEGQTDPYLFRDLFLYERASGEITSPSLRDPGLPLPLTVRERSLLGNVSADGRFVAFQRNGAYLRDAVADTTTRLRAPLSPPYTMETSLNPVLSANGQFAALLSAQSTPGYAEGVFLHDRAAGTYALVNRSPGSATQIDGFPSNYVLSADGRYVAYQCLPCGLVPGHPGTAPNGSGYDEVFLYDRLTGLNTLVSHPAGSPTARADGHSRLPAISADGRYVAFWSDATNLIPGQIDTPATFDLFVFDREAGPTGSIELVTHVPGSPATAAGQANLSFVVPLHLSADGRFIAFQSALPNLVPGQVDTNQDIDVFLRDRTAGTTVLVSHAVSSNVTAGNRPSLSLTHEDPLSISADGRFVVYESRATDLVAGLVDTNGARDVFLYDRQSGANSLVSHAGGDPLKAGNGESESPRISADGSTIGFLSGATDLDLQAAVQHAFSISRSLYAQNRSTGTTAFLAEALKAGRPFNLFPVEEAPIYFAPQLSADGRRIAFNSDSALVLGDYNLTWDVYLWEGTIVEPEEPEEPEGPFPVTPCRLLDTRRRAERPALTSNVQRTVTAHGRCGVPATAKEIVVNVTVFSPSGKGNLRFYPGAATAAPSAILRFDRGTTRTETFTLPLGTNGALTILPFVAGRGTVHGAVEVTGYDD